MESTLTLPPPSPSPSSSFSSSNTGSEMSAEEKFMIVRSVGEECIQEDELRNLLANKPQPICYDGFEPSGRMHIAQGVMKTINVNKLTSAGCKVKLLIADWFAMLNNKLNGDLRKIEVVGRYMIEIWKAVGMNLDQVEFVWSSKEINSRPHEYWPLVMDIGQRHTVGKISSCRQIMGCSEQDDLSAGQILYPCMQCADILFLEADICQLGMDQQNVNVLARDYCDVVKRNKPIILAHHMLPGLLPGQEKMSKTDPTSCIFMDDDAVCLLLIEAVIKYFSSPVLLISLGGAGVHSWRPVPRRWFLRTLSGSPCPGADFRTLVFVSFVVIFTKKYLISQGMVNTKIKQAYCPPKVVLGNPCIEYIQYLVLPWFNEFQLERSDMNGGNKIYTSFAELSIDYESGRLHPGDLKPSLSKALNRILQPVRDHFENDPVAKDLCRRVNVFK